MAVYLGLSKLEISEISKIAMYKFWYETKTQNQNITKKQNYNTWTQNDAWIHVSLSMLKRKIFTNILQKNLKKGLVLEILS